MRWRYNWFCLTISLLLSSFFLGSCSGLSGGGPTTPTATPTPSNLPLARLHWCNKPFTLFRDEHQPVSVTPTATATASTTPRRTAKTSDTPTANPTASTLSDFAPIPPLIG